MLLGIAALLLGASIFRVEPDIGDEAEYLVLGQALATGQGYRQIAEPDAPLETKRPIGYPLVVAASRLVFGDTPLPLQALSLLCFGIAAGGAYLLLWRSCPLPETRGRALCIGAVTLFIANVESLRTAPTIAPDMILTACAVLILLATDRATRTEKTRITAAVLLGLAVAAGFYLRPSAVVLIPAVALCLLLRRRWLPTLAFCLAATLPLVPWALGQKASLRQGQYSYVGAALDPNSAPANPSATTRPGANESPGAAQKPPTLARALVARAVSNLCVYTLKTGQILLARPDSFSPRPRVTKVPDDEPETGTVATSSARSPAAPAMPAPVKRPGFQRLGRYAIGILALLGGLALVVKRPDPSHLYVICTFALLLVMPYNVTRYLVPVLPFLAMYLLWIVTAPMSARLQIASFCAACAITLMLTAPAISQRLLWNLQHRGLPATDASRYGLGGTDGENYIRAAEWIGRNAPADAIIACRKPHNVFRLTGMHATRSPMWRLSAHYVIAATKQCARFGPVYLIDDGFGDAFPNPPSLAVRPAIRAVPWAFREVWRAEKPRTVVWEAIAPETVDPDLADTSPSGAVPK